MPSLTVQNFTCIHIIITLNFNLFKNTETEKHNLYILHNRKFRKDIGNVFSSNMHGNYFFMYKIAYFVKWVSHN